MDSSPALATTIGVMVLGIRNTHAAAAILPAAPRVSHRLPGAKLLTQAEYHHGAVHSEFRPFLHSE